MSKRGIVSIVLLIALIMSIAPLNVMAQDEELPDLGTLKVGYIPIIAFAPFFVALEQGYFAEQGLEVEFELFRTGDAMIAPLSQGQLDVGGGETGPALFNAVDLDLDVRVVGALASQPPGNGAVPLLVRTDLFESGEIDELADLEGRRIAVNVERGMAEYLVASAMGQVDLTVDDVELVAIPFPEIPAAFANEAIDAAILPHPLAGAPLRDGDAVVLLDGDQIAETPQNGVMYFGTRLLDPENREVAVRFMVAYLTAVRELQGDAFRSDDALVGAIQTWTNVPEPAVRNGVAYYFEPNAQIFRASTEDIQAYHVGRGYTELDEPLPLDDIIINDILEEALERVGVVEVEEEPEAAATEEAGSGD